MKKLFSLSFLFFVAFSLKSQCPATLQVTNSNGLNSNQLKLEFDSNTTPDSSTTISLDFGATDSRSGQYQVILSGRTWETLPQTNEYFKGNLDLFVTTDNSLCSYENGLLTPEPVCYKDSKWYGSCAKSKPIWRTGSVHIGQNNSTAYKLEVNGDTYADGELTIEGGTGLGIMTTTEREAYDNSRDGILVFDSDKNRLYISNNGEWLRLTTTKDISFTAPNTVAMIAVAGQSNAAGSNNNNQFATSEWQNFSTPNVFSMSETSREWEEFGINSSNFVATNVLENNGNRYDNPLYSIAEEWQLRITNGEALPDLYILNVSKGGNGFSTELTTNSRWNPFAFCSPDNTCTWPNQTIGVLSTNVSLFNLLDDAIRAGIQELKDDGKQVMYMGTVWSQWEEDATSQIAALEYATNIRRLRRMIDEAVGYDDANFYYFYPVSDAGTEENRAIIKEAYESFESYEKNVFRIDLKSPGSLYDPLNTTSFGIFADNLHYNRAAQEWAAQQILIKMLDW